MSYSFTNLFPNAGISQATQLNKLQQAWIAGLMPKLIFRRAAEKQRVMAHNGQTITITLPGLMTPTTGPTDISNLNNIDNGLSNIYGAAEQVTLNMGLYANTTNVPATASSMSTGDYYLYQANALAIAMGTTLDNAARQTLWDAYLGGQTAVTTTLGSPATTIAVDDVRGFQFVIPTSGSNKGVRLAVSSSNVLPIQIWNGTTWVSYNVTGYTIDGTNTSKAIATGGVSGTLTTSANVSTAAGTAGNAVRSVYAPLIVRPDNARSTGEISTSAGYLTLQMLRNATVSLQSNNVEKLGEAYDIYVTPEGMFQLQQDSEFQSFFRGGWSTSAFKLGIVNEAMGLRIIETTQAPIQAGTLSSPTQRIARATVVGRDALFEGFYVDEKFQQETPYIARAAGKRIQMPSSATQAGMLPGGVFVIRSPIDNLLMNTQFSSYSIMSWASRTDALATPDKIATATSSYYKRAVIVEHRSTVGA